MSIKEIQDLIKLMDKSSLSEFYYKNEEYEIKIKGQRQVGNAVYTTPTPMPSPLVAPIVTPQVSIPQVESAPKSEPVKEAAPAANAKYIEIRSPMVGTFYRSPGPDKPAFVNVGDTIQKGSPVCIIEAMKLFNEIESEVSGKVVKVLVEDASPVEYDQVLFLLEE
jgi:acetyl-CoA carboxylase biotin carboxyl carrier protein